MTTAEKEVQIMRLGSPWVGLMNTLRNARDVHTAKWDAEAGSDEALRDTWRAYFRQHYEEDLDLILDIAARRSMAGA